MDVVISSFADQGEGLIVTVSITTTKPLVVIHAWVSLQQLMNYRESQW